MILAERRKAQAESVLKNIASEYGISVGEMLSRCREPDVDRARRHAMAVLRWSTNWSFPVIGKIFGRDHTTVMHAIRKYEAELNP